MFQRRRLALSVRKTRLFVSSITQWSPRRGDERAATASRRRLARRRFVGLFDDGVDCRAGDSWRWRAAAATAWLHMAAPHLRLGCVAALHAVKNA
jgi:hypothetical protein